MSERGKSERRTVKSAVYTPAAERTDSDPFTIGDVTYVSFEECDHVSLGNPTMHYAVGSKLICHTCAKEER